MQGNVKILYRGIQRNNVVIDRMMYQCSQSNGKKCKERKEALSQVLLQPKDSLKKKSIRVLYMLAQINGCILEYYERTERKGAGEREV